MSAWTYILAFLFGMALGSSRLSDGAKLWIFIAFAALLVAPWVSR